MDAFSASLMADKREIVFAPTVYKFQTFAQMAEEFKLGERDVVLTNEFIYTPFMKDLDLKCNFVFQEKFGAGEPSEAMIQTMYDAIPYDSYDRVIAVGGGAIMDLCKLLGCKRPDTVHNLYFKRFPVVHEKDVIAIPTTSGTGSEATSFSIVTHNGVRGLHRIDRNRRNRQIRSFRIHGFQHPEGIDCIFGCNIQQDNRRKPLCGKRHRFGIPLYRIDCRHRFACVDCAQ